MNVPLLDLKAQYATIRDEMREAVDRVLEAQQFIMGPEVAALEKAVADYVGARHGIGMSSGTDALLATLMAYDVGPGDRVIAPAYSFFATAGVIARLHAVPVLVDIDAASYNLSPSSLEQLWGRLDRSVQQRVKAIVPVHLYGQCADMARILEVADRIGVPVIEDAAQSIGTIYRDGRFAGTLGTMGCFSFFPSKNLGGIGDGGMVVTSDDGLAERLRLLRNHGAQPKYYHKIVGGNFRLDTIQAAALLVKLRHLDAWHEARQKHADLYRDLFRQAGLVGTVGLPEVVDPTPGVRSHIYNQFVIRTPNRDALREFLTAQGIGTEIYYPVPFHLQECFGDLGHKAGEFPESERAAHETLALPVYPELMPEQQAYVVERVAAFHKVG
ncbi:MAG TPA: DegT/DnrJ/EryC1/StrS family aminotransferase [Verrucomicrobiae bacterium]|nr:DegT/DnrJ/EryC1/StrS family aminotransferase [Verrucomicrobiae bacterium]